MKAFANYHPAVLLLYFLSVLLVGMFVTNPVLQLTMLLGAVLFCLMLPHRSGGAGFYVPMFLLVAVTNPLFSHNGVTPLFYLNGNPVTLEAFVYGAAIAVMVVGVMLWCACYSAVMTSDKFLCLFGRVIPKLALVLSMALRFIPMFKRQMHKVNRAQKAMGLYGSKSLVDKGRSALRVFLTMISWSLENAIDTAASMKARGYGLPGRSRFALFRFRAADAALAAVSVLLLGLTLAGTAAGATVFCYYPRISALPLSPFSVAVYAAFGLLSFQPFVIDATEALVWNYYVAKM